MSEINTKSTVTTVDPQFEGSTVEVVSEASTVTLGVPPLQGDPLTVEATTVGVVAGITEIVESTVVPMTVGRIAFDEVPPIGTIFKKRGGMYRLIGIAPYTRKDGTASYVLTWQGTDGALATSGLRSKSVMRVTAWRLI
jgi:hypothetical protein